MQKSRFLVVPSHSDHWPLVVNEGTLCGCGLILSSIIGNIPELSNDKNSIIFNVGSSNSLLRALKRSVKLSDSSLKLMFDNSIKLSSKYGINDWVTQYNKIIRVLQN